MLHVLRVQPPIQTGRCLCERDLFEQIIQPPHVKEGQRDLFWSGRECVTLSAA